MSKFYLFCLFSLIFGISSQQIEKTFIKGSNFQGEIQLLKKSLMLNIVEYTYGDIYSSEITNEIIEQNPRRFQVVKNIEELYSQLKRNQRIQVNDNKLLMLVQVIYRRRQSKIQISIPLQARKFSNEGEKFKILLSVIEAINKQKIRIQEQQTPKLIKFKGDQTNSLYRFFEVSNQGSRVRLTSDYPHYTYNHFETLPKKGIHYFKLRVIRTLSKKIFLGICGKNIKSQPVAYFNPFFMGLYLESGHLYINQRAFRVIPDPNIAEGIDILKVQIDMNKKWVSWFLNDRLLYAAEIPRQISEMQFYPMVNLYHNNDTVQFINR